MVLDNIGNVVTVRWVEGTPASSGFSTCYSLLANAQSIAIEKCKVNGGAIVVCVDKGQFHSDDCGICRPALTLNLTKWARNKGGIEIWKLIHQHQLCSSSSPSGHLINFVLDLLWERLSGTMGFRKWLISVYISPRCSCALPKSIVPMLEVLAENLIGFSFLVTFEQKDLTDDNHTNTGVDDLLADLGNFYENIGGSEERHNINQNENQDKPMTFVELLKKAEQELYPGCSEFSNLSFIVHLLHLKVYNKWSNKSFDMMLKLLKKALPNGETLPKSYYDAKKVLNDLGLGYIAIHACKYDCALFWEEYENFEECPTCGTSRWKVNNKGKKIPHKILRYFPLKQRLQRFLGTLKSYVRNKARPKGSIAEAYIVNECLTFCSMYLDGVETHFNKEERNFDIEADNELSIFSQKLRLFGAAKYIELSKKEQDMSHWYILTNCEGLEGFQAEHMEILKRESSLNLEERHKDQFPQWFKEHITHLKYHNSEDVTDEIYALACGPHRIVKKYPGCIVNGVRFYTKERDSHRTTQNSGVMVEGYHDNHAIKFYGIVNEIIELDYVKDKRVVLFKAQWFNSGGKKSTIQVDGSITAINVSRTWYEEDPFVLASQTKQVFYIDDVKLGKNWRIVQEFQHRHVFDTMESDLVILG
ncbi:hypothetical protein BUALT_Bualt07G0108800 [Buddleja alternifolia]|uniref:DUF4218 domain-containing protein n=1 Tax=Buddleja alternifolia TaxID=168488 RepID=A0AAV6XB36_9LAMI|nr:hypothetical protein BUALT_Bualt07G0108800 [Buddleja alternifolia]